MSIQFPKPSHPDWEWGSWMQPQVLEWWFWHDMGYEQRRAFLNMLYQDAQVASECRARMHDAFPEQVHNLTVLLMEEQKRNRRLRLAWLSARRRAKGTSMALATADAVLRNFLVRDQGKGKEHL